MNDIVAENHDETFKPLTALRAILDTDLDAHAKLVACVLVKHADASGECYPALPRIMAQSSLSRRECIYSLQALERAAVIEVTRRRGQANQYRCTLCTGAQYAPVQDMHGCGAQYAPGGCTGCTPTSAQDAPKLPITTAYKTAQRSAQTGRRRKRRVGEEIDFRVQPVLQVFHDAYVKRIGKEPPKTVLDYGRDGKRIRELPADHTTEDLTGAVSRFFDSTTPGYIARNLRFADFVAALPRLLQGEPPKAERPRRARYVEGAQARDYDDYFPTKKEG